jgi:hypothetical protein
MTRRTRHRLPPPLRQGSRTPSSPSFAWAVKWPPRRMEDWSRCPLCGASARCVKTNKCIRLACMQVPMPAWSVRLWVLGLQLSGGVRSDAAVFLVHTVQALSPYPNLALSLPVTNFRRSTSSIQLLAFAGDSQLPAQCRHVHGGSSEPCDGYWPACSKQWFVGGGDRRWARAGPLAATPDRTAHWRHQQHVLCPRGTAI